MNWATADDTAIAGTDYEAASGSLTFAAGEATQTVQVTVIGESTPEPPKTFKLILTPAGGTAIMGLASLTRGRRICSSTPISAKAIPDSRASTVLNRSVPERWLRRRLHPELL